MENLAQEWFLAYFSYEIQGDLLFKQTIEKNNRYQKQAHTFSTCICLN